MTFKERIVLGVLASGLALALFAPSCDPKPIPQPTIQEDDPGWDCHTMGNRICGPK